MRHPDFPGGVHLADFEFRPCDGHEGNPLEVVALVVHDIGSGTTQRFWHDELAQMHSAPFRTEASAVFVAYNASAEMACFRALGWPYPPAILDLCCEFRNLTNGLVLPAGKGLLGALAYFGEPCMDAAEKELMRELILRGGPWTEAEKMAILNYCEADVLALKRLYLRMEHGV